MPLKSRFPSVELEKKPVADLILDNLRTYGDAPALIDRETRKTYSFNEVYTVVQRVAAGLHAAGLRKGDVLVIYLRNCPEWALTFVAAAQRGAIISGINPVYTADEVRHHIEDSAAKFVVTSGSLLNVVNRAISTRSLKAQVQKIFVVNPTAKFHPGKNTINFSVLCNHEGSYSRIPAVHIDAKNDIVLLPYSSGTTGVPKGVMLTHYNLSGLTTIAKSSGAFLWPQQGDIYLAVLPFYHIFGFMVLVGSLTMGITTVTLPKFELEKFLKAIQDYKVKMLFAVPPMVVFLAKHPVVDKYDVSSIKAVLVGAAPVGKDLSEELIRRLPSIDYIVQAYGMTETSGASHMMPPIAKDQLRHGSVGLIAPNFECKVLDLESGEELGANERGEICVRSPTCMTGYWRRPDSTAATMDAQRWLHTGDIGYYDKDEFFYVVDRLKELIKVKGFQVAPAELEDLLLAHPQVQDAAVIGVADSFAGELPRAYIVKKPHATLTEQHIYLFLKDRVAPYKQLKGGIEFVLELPKSPSGKILRRVLKDKLGNQMTSSKL